MKRQLFFGARVLVPLEVPASAVGGSELIDRLGGVIQQ